MVPGAADNAIINDGFVVKYDANVATTVNSLNIGGLAGDGVDLGDARNS